MEGIAGIFIICCLSFLGPSTGVEDGELHGCPISPNCISSQSWKYNFIHKTSPYHYKESRSEAYQKILRLLDGRENVYVAEKRENEYIRTIYFTKVFRFPDKVEFYFEPNTNVIQVRSQSIVGLWDIMANRIRIEWIRKDLAFE